MSLIKGNHAGLGGSGAPGGSLGSFYSRTIDQSIRVERGDPGRLDISFSGDGDSQALGTFSWWMKRTELGRSQSNVWFEQSGYGGIQFRSDKLAVNSFDSSNTQVIVQTDAVFRDSSSWYHFMVRVNGTAGTIQFYINGVEQAQTVTNGSLASSRSWDFLSHDSRRDFYLFSNSNGSNGTSALFAEFHFLDGLSYDPSYFGETKDGVWIPKAYSGSHGTNGFYLPFDDSSAIGDDESANTNDFSVNGLTASDVVLDSPTNNFATLNPLAEDDVNIKSGAVLSEGNLVTATAGFGSGSAWGGGQSTLAIPTDKKIYCEVLCSNQEGNYWGAGVSIPELNANNTGVSNTGQISVYNRAAMVNGVETDYGSSAGLGGLGVSKLAVDDILQIAVDGATGKVWFGRNGTYFKSPSTNNSGTTGDPAAGSNEIGTVTNTDGKPLFIVIIGGSATCHINFGADSSFAGRKTAQGNADGEGFGDFYYTPPTGYLALCSSNMSDPAIGPGQSSQADDHFNTVLYTGNGSTQNITGVGFQPDWTWIKNRAATDAHALTDSVRGVTKEIQTNALSAESTNADGLTAFGADGFSLGDDDIYNTNTETYVSWNWKGGGSASTNTDGSGIDSSVSANATAGISILTYTGTGNTSHTIGHGLGKTPAFVMSKSRDTGSGGGSYWFIKWNGQTSNNNLLLNFTDAQTNIATNYAGGGWSDFDSSNTTTIVPRIGYTGSSVDSVNKSGEDYVAYVFAQVEGFSAMGSFKGNGADDGPFVYTGFRPAWLWIKRVDAANDWHMMDDHRNPINVMDGLLFANLTNGETSDAAYNRDFVSNGFKIRGSEAYVNASGGTFVYMAFAHSPLKFANAF